MPRLIISSGTAPERTVELDAQTVSIGRDAGNTVPLEGEGKSSRRHCQVALVSGGGYEVVDLKSTNGTRVNGSPVERRRLRHGDTIEVGLTKIRFEDEAAAAAAAETADVCYLEWTSGDRRGERVPLTATRTSLGRRDSNAIVLQDKMASSHHAEIVKDLNGYTVRDLGSTNGTLVNGEPVTETMLTHGSRLRIGNAKFVFKDPSMADVEVALEGVEEDDGGWGMMGELDMSRARGGGAGGVIAAVALLAVLAGGAYWMSMQSSKQAEAVADATNFVDDGGFDTTELISWTVDEGSPAVAERTAQGRPSGGGALLVRHDGKGSGPGVARYGEDLEISATGTYKVSGWMKRDGGGRADLAVQWIRLGNVRSGATPVTETVAVGSPAKAGSWAQVGRTVRRPGWADAARLVVVVGPDAAAKVDDVRFVPVDGAPASGGKFDAAGEAEAYVASTGGLDVARTKTVLFVGATPWAKMKDGRVLGGASQFEVDGAVPSASDGAQITGRLVDAQGSVPASITWSRTPEKDGLLAKVTVEGAESVGLACDVVVAHLEDGIGVLLTAGGSRRVSATPGPAIESVRKVLLGDPNPIATPDMTRSRTLFALDLVGAEGGGTFTSTDSGDAGLLRVALAKPGSSTAEVRVMTSFEGEQTRARAALSQGLSLLDTSAGEGMRRLRQVAAEFPFEAEVRKTALERAATREDQARKDSKELTETLDRLKVYGDVGTLSSAESLAGRLSREFPPVASGAGALEQTIQEQLAQVSAARARYDLAAAGPEVRRLFKLGQMLEKEPGYEAVAAVYYDTVARRYGGLEKAGAAASSPGDAEVVKNVTESRERRDALLAKPEVRAAVPNLPE